MQLFNPNSFRFSNHIHSFLNFSESGVKAVSAAYSTDGASSVAVSNCARTLEVLTLGRTNPSEEIIQQRCKDFRVLNLRSLERFWGDTEVTETPTTIAREDENIHRITPGKTSINLPNVSENLSEHALDQAIELLIREIELHEAWLDGLLFVFMGELPGKDLSYFSKDSDARYAEQVSYVVGVRTRRNALHKTKDAIVQELENEPNVLNNEKRIKVIKYLDLITDIPKFFVDPIGFLSALEQRLTSSNLMSYELYFAIRILRDTLIRDGL